MRTYWTDDMIQQGIFDSMSALCISRMPTGEELKRLGKNGLHCKISRHPLKYSGWAQKLGLDLKSCNTRVGNWNEHYVGELLERQGFTVEYMSTKHPYDLLINGSVKIDVKVGSAYFLRGSLCHTFAFAKRYATCDIYICVALALDSQIDRIFIIPSHKAKIVTLSVGTESAYNQYVDKWGYINQYVKFYQSV